MYEALLDYYHRRWRRANWNSHTLSNRSIFNFTRMNMIKGMIGRVIIFISSSGICVINGR
jgi:hypothetical protein